MLGHGGAPVSEQQPCLGTSAQWVENQMEQQITGSPYGECDAWWGDV